MQRQVLPLNLLVGLDQTHQKSLNSMAIEDDREKGRDKLYNKFKKLFNNSRNSSSMCTECVTVSSSSFT
jgi:hypothetical protein